MTSPETLLNGYSVKQMLYNSPSSILYCIGKLDKKQVKDIEFHRIFLQYVHIAYKLLGLGVGQEPIKFILPEFVFYLGGRGVLCEGNG